MSSMSEMNTSAHTEAPALSDAPTPVDDEAHSKDASDDTVIHNTADVVNTTDQEAHLLVAPAATQDTVTQILQFFAGASDAVLIAIAVAVAALLYLVFGQLGLLAVGVVAGVLLHAHWVGLHGEKEHSIEKLEKALEGRGTQKIKSMLDIEEEENDVRDLSGFKDFRPETAAALDEIVSRTITDYVSYWYTPNHPGEESVPRSAKATLVHFIRSVSRTLSKKRPADAFILFLTNTSSIVTTFFGELGNAIKESQDIDVAPEDAVGLYLTAHPESTLSYLLDEKQQHTRFLREADEMLRHHIDKATYNCSFAKTFLQQTLCWDIFETTLKTISKPEWFNGWIVYLLEEGEPDLLQAIDEGMSNESKAAMKPAKERKESGNDKRMSRVVDDQAMEEARRLSELMAEEDLRRATEAAIVPPRPAEDPVQESVPHPVVQETVTPGLPSHPGTTTSSEEKHQTFTSFDQLPTPKVITEEPSEMPIPSPTQALPPLTLHNANITILDDSMPGDKNRTLRSKPSDDYLVQIEPQDSRHPGWMIVRRYDDFETLHEVLKRIAQVSGASNFTKNHSSLPTWKGETKPGLRIGLENYLMSACQYQPLAESVGLKRFLEKENQGPTGKGSPGIGWPKPAAFETMGKGLVDGLMGVSKGAADGRKSVFGGMTGVFSGNRNRADSRASVKSSELGRSSTSLPLEAETAPVNGTSPFKSDSATAVRKRSDSKASLRPSHLSKSSISLPRLVEDAQVDRPPSPSEKKANPRLRIPGEDPVPVSLQTTIESIMGSSVDNRAPVAKALRIEDYTSNGMEATSSRTSTCDVASDGKSSAGASQDVLDLESLQLPPPPSDMPDDYGLGVGLDGSPASAFAKSVLPGNRTSTDTFASVSDKAFITAPPKLKLERIEPEPFTEQETRDALELIFAMISSLYTLSSAWSLRLTLLTAAKTFLLRPGNPSLLYIQKLLRDSVIARNTSDSGIATHLRKIRENGLPTEEELKQWPPELPEWEKEKLRTKARALLLEKGIPSALTGVMGTQATGQALGRVFDTLQDGRVLRGLMFGLLMQGVSVLTH